MTFEMPFIGQVPKVSEEADDNAPGDVEEKIITNETIDRILHPGLEEQATSINEPTAKIDNEKARNLDIACVETDPQDANKVVCSFKFTLSTLRATTLKHGTHVT